MAKTSPAMVPSLPKRASAFVESNDPWLKCKKIANIIFMNSQDTLNPQGKFSYAMDFRYGRFDSDLKLTDFINSVLTITVWEPVPEHMYRNWLSVIQQINPDLHKVEIINVRDLGEADV